MTLREWLSKTSNKFEETNKLPTETYRSRQPLYVPAERERTTAKLSPNGSPTICRISLRYIQQMAGVPHQSLSQIIASEFSEIYINGAQLRRYTKEYYEQKIH